MEFDSSFDLLPLSKEVSYDFVLRGQTADLGQYRMNRRGLLAWFAPKSHGASSETPQRDIFLHC